jgi:diguanylate cyclase (GGDEF)-like protein
LTIQLKTNYRENLGEIIGLFDVPAIAFEVCSLVKASAPCAINTAFCKLIKCGIARAYLMTFSEIFQGSSINDPTIMMGRRPFIVNGKHIKVHTYDDERITCVIRTKYINHRNTKFLIITLTPVNAKCLLPTSQDSFYCSPTALFEGSEQGDIVIANDAFWKIVGAKKEDGFNLENFALENMNASMSAFSWLEKFGSMHNHVMKIAGNNKYFSININTVVRDGKKYYCGNIDDVTSNVLKQKKDQHIMYHDPMTGLFNRRAYEEKIQGFDIKMPAMIVICDMDNLKLVNDAFSHQFGDYAIMIIAEALNKVFADGFVARIGGDEFVVILENNTGDDIEKKIALLKSLCNIAICSNITSDVSVGHARIDEPYEYKKALDTAENMMYRQKYSGRAQRRNKLMNALAKSLYADTGETKRHCTFVSQLCYEILKEMNHLRSDELQNILVAGKLHDIGKITVSKDILKSKEPLTEDQMKEVRHHSEAGYKILSSITNSPDIMEGILHHHERYDGTGYPYGLKGKDIPLFARIIAVADAYDAMTQRKEYGELLSQPQAIVEIVSNSGAQFDPDVVAAFSKVNLNKLTSLF